jgi:hypothetical protein
MSGDTEADFAEEYSAVRRFVPVALAVIGDILVSVIANAVKAPSQFYFIPILVLAAVTTKMLVDYIDGQSADRPEKMPKRAPAPPAAGGVGVVAGRVITIRPSLIAIPGALCLFAAFWFFIFAVASFFDSGSSCSCGQGQGSANPLQGTILALIAITLTAAGLYMTISVRPRLVFSSDGLYIRDAHGKVFIRWTEVTNMYTVSKCGMTRLLAEFPPDSRRRLERRFHLVRGNKDTFRICNLSISGIRSHCIDDALKFWSPFKRPRYTS